MDEYWVINIEEIIKLENNDFAIHKKNNRYKKGSSMDIRGNLDRELDLLGIKVQPPPNQISHQSQGKPCWASVYVI